VDDRVAAAGEGQIPEAHHLGTGEGQAKRVMCELLTKSCDPGPLP
jgi:hypothetical protein